MERLTDESNSKRARHIPFYVKRFVAGTQADDAVKVARKLADRGISATLDLLGENVTNHKATEAFTQSYIHLLDSMHNAKLLPYISVKLTMLGLDLDSELCYEKIAKVMAHADQLGGRVCLDMEGSPYTERTLTFYERLCKSYRAPEIVLQAYLRRTQEDVARVLAANGRMRLCKGAYKEPPQLALQKMPEIRDNYLNLLERLLAKGQRICIASHDDTIIAAASDWIQKNQIPQERYEFQMLYGLREKTWSSLRNKGHEMTVYVPYGTDWQAYYKRRLSERKENIFFIFRNFFRN